MSTRYQGGLLRSTSVTPTGNYQDSSASGLWTLEQASYWAKQGLWPTTGNIPPTAYVDPLFSSFIYKGTGSTQTISTNIDLSSNTGMVWIHPRTIDASLVGIHDTVRGASARLATNLTDSAVTLSAGVGLTGFGSTGFTVGTGTGYNGSNEDYVAWTFRKNAKFFDIVTYTGDGTASRSISHNLGSKPGCIFIKCTSSSSTAWISVNRNSSGEESVRVLNSTIASVFSPVTNNNSYPNLGNSSTFNVTSNFDSYEPTSGAGNMSCNASGATYVAYLFAHNAGGYGATGNENIITCSSYTGVGGTNNATTEQTGVTVDLGWQPQFLLIKNVSTAGDWWIFDAARGSPVADGNGIHRFVYANKSSTESSLGGTYQYLKITNNGFKITCGTGAYFNETGNEYVYIAIRRGPMITPTDATKVFKPTAYTGQGTTLTTINAGFPVDFTLNKLRESSTYNLYALDRIRGSKFTFDVVGNAYGTSEISTSNDLLFTSFNNGLVTSSSGGNYFPTNTLGSTFINYSFKRAPGFFDIVTYTGDGSAQAVPHKLTTQPYLILIKRRDASGNWGCYYNDTVNEHALLFNTDASRQTAGVAFGVNTSTFTVYNSDFPMLNNQSGSPYVAYLFGSLEGISKIGQYSGNGSTQTINCSFTSGARFVMIKRANSTGNWYLWDTARGINSSSNDPYITSNSAAAEVTNTNYIEPHSTGFTVNTSIADLNASGGTYIYLAIA